VRGLLGDLIATKYDFTIADMEAGIEHLSRAGGTLRHIDMLLIVIEPYRKAVETARRTFGLASDLGIPKIYGIASKVRDEVEAKEVSKFAEELGLEMLATIPYDDAMRLADREGSAVIDFSPDCNAVKAVGELLTAVEAATARV